MSRSTRSARLYGANRRAKPIVSTCGSSTFCSCGRSAVCRRSRRCACFDQPVAGVDDQPALERLVRLPQLAGRHVLEAGPDFRFAGAQVPVERQHAVVQHAASAAPASVGTCTPLVMWPIGISSSLRHGHRLAHIRRLTTPCRFDTAFARRLRLERQHRHAERLVLVVRVDAAQAHERLVAESQFVGQRPEVLLDQAAVEAVVTGGTGVCVVNTLIAAVSRSASSNDSRRPSSASRMISSAANAECPSFMWITPG